VVFSVEGQQIATWPARLRLRRMPQSAAGGSETPHRRSLPAQPVHSGCHSTSPHLGGGPPGKVEHGEARCGRAPDFIPGAEYRWDWRNTCGADGQQLGLPCDLAACRHRGDRGPARGVWRL